MNRYFFLDIDGVLNSERSVAAYGRLITAGRVKDDILNGVPPDPLWDEIAVKLLRVAQEELGFKIVISSTWRSKCSLPDYHTIFRKYGWETNGIIVGMTGHEPGVRGNQIKGWLDAHAKYPYAYCIIDDGSDMLDSQLPFFVKTSFENGLDYSAFAKIYDAFGETYTPVGSF